MISLARPALRLGFGRARARRNRRTGALPWFSLGILALVVGSAILAPLLHLADPAQMAVRQRLALPSLLYPLGRDEFGRDVLSRLIWGGRISLTVAGSAVLIACLVGTTLGILGGYLKRGVDLVTVRLMEIVLCFPPMLLALLTITLLGPGAGTLTFVIAVLFAPKFARIAYAGVLSVAARDFVEAMRSLGAGRLRIMARTILPNISGPILTQIGLAASAAIVLESGLSFLGIGITPPTPSWGSMIRGARATMGQAPWLLLWPCVTLTAAVLGLNGVCDWLRGLIDAERRPPTRSAVSISPAPPPAPLPEIDRQTLTIRDLTVRLETAGGSFDPVQHVSLDLRAGETLAIVGESGSGKSMTGLALMGLLPPSARVARGGAWLGPTELLRLPDERLRHLRGRDIAMVFQDPLSSLDPVHRISDQIAEALRAHAPMRAGEARRRSLELLRHVGIPDPERRARAFPHELSGGMRQRVGIAMAIANGPKLLIADEPTTALDVTIQAQILDLLAALQRESGLSMIFITHNLAIVGTIAQRVAVMYAGEIVETGPVEAVFAAPLHPYTAALLASAPREGDTTPSAIPGAVPLPSEMPAGCRFAPRCTHAIADCDSPVPLVEAMPGRATRCIRWAAA